MSELNFELLQTNIRSLLKKHNITQAELATIAGMSQSNVSKALSRKDPKQFTLDQLYRIAQHFKVSIDKLTGNKAPENSSTSSRAVLLLLIDLLKSDKAKVFQWTKQEEVFEVSYDWEGPSCDHCLRDIEYPAIYFPSYIPYSDVGLSYEEAGELFAEYSQCGNHTPFHLMNETIQKLLPMIDLYKKGDIPEEAFDMIVNGYLEKFHFHE